MAKQRASGAGKLGQGEDEDAEHGELPERPARTGLADPSLDEGGGANEQRDFGGQQGQHVHPERPKSERVHRSGLGGCDSVTVGQCDGRTATLLKGGSRTVEQAWEGPHRPTA